MFSKYDIHIPTVSKLMLYLHRGHPAPTLPYKKGLTLPEERFGPCPQILGGKLWNVLLIDAFVSLGGHGQCQTVYVNNVIYSKRRPWAMVSLLEGLGTKVSSAGSEPRLCDQPQQNSRTPWLG